MGWLFFSGAKNIAITAEIMMRTAIVMTMMMMMIRRIILMVIIRGRVIMVIIRGRIVMVRIRGMKTILEIIIIIENKLFIFFSKVRK